MALTHKRVEQLIRIRASQVPSPSLTKADADSGVIPVSAKRPARKVI